MFSIDNKQLCDGCFSEIQTEPCPICGFSNKTYSPLSSILPVGSMLKNRYRIGSVIGQGGFGITYRAYDTKYNEVISIKEYYPNSLAVRSGKGYTVTATTAECADIFKNGVEKFCNEAKLVSKFNGNPNIVSVYEFFYENETAYFSMEFLKGVSLKSYIDKNGVITSEQALDIFLEISSALIVTHSADVLHRDISPDNIMLLEGGGVKLVDFGAARQVIADDPRSKSVILKEGFAPLEQYIRKGNQGPWTDIYSLGSTIFYALTKEKLDNPMTRQSDDDERVKLSKDSIDAELWSIINKCIQIKYQDRYQNAFELKADLKKISFKAMPIILPVGASQEYNMSIQERTSLILPKDEVSEKQIKEIISDNVEQPKKKVEQDEPEVKPVPENSIKTDDKGKKSSFNIKLFVSIIAVLLIVIGIISCAVILNNTSDIPVSGSIQDTDSITATPATATTSITTEKDDSSVTNISYKDKNGLELDYTGDWKNGKPNGQGKAVWKNGDKYDGQWKDGLRSGDGNMTYSGAGTYIGQFKDDVRSGQGTFYKSNGDQYSGQWKDDEYNGVGEYFFSDGRKFKGTYLKGKASGEGTFIYANGDKIEGKWKNDEIDGECVITYTDKDLDKYVGEFKNWKRSGIGVLYWSDGRRYEGDWKNDVREGKGQQYSTDGRLEYEGDWKDDKYSYGTEFYSDGARYTGNFVNWIRNGEGTYYWDSGNKYTGDFKDGLSDGKGVFYGSNGYKYDGEWKNDKYDGYGIEYMGNGKERYEGYFKNGKYNGNGTYYYADGTVYYSGTWKDGQRHTG